MCAPLLLKAGAVGGSWQWNCVFIVIGPRAGLPTSSWKSQPSASSCWSIPAMGAQNSCGGLHSLYKSLAERQRGREEGARMCGCGFSDKMKAVSLEAAAGHLKATTVVDKQKGSSGRAHGKGSPTDGACGRMQGAGPEHSSCLEWRAELMRRGGRAARGVPSRGQSQTHFSGKPVEPEATAGLNEGGVRGMTDPWVRH